MTQPNEKRIYQEAEICLVEVNNGDIICTSGGTEQFQDGGSIFDN